MQPSKTCPQCTDFAQAALIGQAVAGRSLHQVWPLHVWGGSSKQRRNARRSEGVRPAGEAHASPSCFVAERELLLLEHRLINCCWYEPRDVPIGK